MSRMDCAVYSVPQFVIGTILLIRENLLGFSLFWRVDHVSLGTIPFTLLGSAVSRYYWNLMKRIVPVKRPAGMEDWWLLYSLLSVCSGWKDATAGKSLKKVQRIVISRIKNDMLIAGEKLYQEIHRWLFRSQPGSVHLELKRTGICYIAGPA